MPELLYGVNQNPGVAATLFYALQQVMVCLPGLIINPEIISDLLCAGDRTRELKIYLISANFISAGVGTILQTTFGLRLAMMHGPAAAFLPPLFAYKASFECKYGKEDHVPEEEWMDRFSEISASLFVGCLWFLLIGISGLAGVLAKRIGPITIVPVMILLVYSIIGEMIHFMQTHWISAFTLVLTAFLILYMERVPIPLPGERSFLLFAQFPLIIVIAISWSLCGILSLSGVESVNSTAHTSVRMEDVLWIDFPNPFQYFTRFKFNAALIVAFTTSVLVDLVENLGSYDLLSKSSNQKKAPKDAINRAIINGTFKTHLKTCAGSLLAASLGVCCGLTTYSSNIAVTQITKVASRRTMQIAGLLLVIIGVLPKTSAFLAAIPSPVIGGLTTVLIAMVIGVSISNLHTVDLKLSRNCSIMGCAITLGFLIPMFIKENKMNTGFPWLDELLNMNLSTYMLVGGVIAVFLDNTLTGASMTQRGLKTPPDEDETEMGIDGYKLPTRITRVASKIPIVRSLPVFPKMTTTVHPAAETESTKSS